MNINQEVARIIDELAIADAETEAEIENGKLAGKMATPEYRNRRRKWEEIRHQKRLAAEVSHESR